jgi:hypothetical protein
MSREHSLQPSGNADLVSKLNLALETYSDKDWNYSRISLESCSLQSLDSSYVLWVEPISTHTKQGVKELKCLQEEITWGSRHSNELGLAELVSLRINKALLEVTSDEYWGDFRPVVRLVKKELLAQQGVVEAFWYRVREVSGEDFDNR